ncbi:metal-dependent hydrolase [Marichromatium bheemlicum]|uniref:Metal-dependent hydrolase n=2 Tax=Marichromatium bheemlicum TaxID=365339 RepID=A0ABX1I687_9GAMM|nr:metal-dependent hydrolase [Marichromatium bheemlicum]NKN33080.1 metal-dependent hydrolase [Marichromatium bheemlicum]
MANFHTHINVGIFVSGASVLGLHAAGLVEQGQTLTLFALGVGASLLPDVDSDTSRPVRAFFTVLGAGLAFAMTLPLVGQLLLFELALVWGGVFLCVRYGFFELFTRFTVHRGIWHSWLAAAVWSLATVNAAHWLLEHSARAAWVAGLMVAIGYFTHLLLDELYSVDLLNSRIKRSFGTALKPLSLNDPLSSLSLLALAVWLAWIAPDPGDWPAFDRAITGVRGLWFDLGEVFRDWGASLVGLFG